MAGGPMSGDSGVTDGLHCVSWLFSGGHANAGGTRLVLINTCHHLWDKMICASGLVAH